MTEKLGERALEAIKKMDNAVVEFKMPKVPRTKRGQMKILTEEQYIEELGKIIQKDFFPDLEKLKAQNAYLDAMEKNDIIKLREIYAKYSGHKPNEPLGSESPATFETPQREDWNQSTFSTPSSRLFQERNSDALSTTSRRSKKAPSDGHTLDSFLATHTSEDNCSFEELIETADKKLRQKFAVLFEAEQQTAMAIALSLDLPKIEDQFKEIIGPKRIDTWKYTNKNSIMYVPDGVELSKAEQLERVDKKQEIEYNNTRFNANPFNDQQNKDTITDLAKAQSNNLNGRVGIDGNAVTALSERNVRGFSFVATPSPQPGVAESPLMTWGELEGTPFRLDGSDTPVRPSSGPSFRIAETSRRETIAHSLAEKAGERMRNQKAKALEAARRNISSPHIRSTMDRLASMSPAAKRLASSSIGVKDHLLTPSPRTPLSQKTPATPSPLIRRKTPLVRTPSSKQRLTDDLLNIPIKSKRS
ncbi:splicing factor ESS-2 homolog [Contarinia nasturtii]|uniref:splicing factor ESS-2 homolog n=1 Tax=Contarinia nasturtii TaxID=265458 RepID=UPI0012D3D02A|nr:splicing factor ESS-2 homolog [Contarinia nasturtii]